MTMELTTHGAADIVERVVIEGDLSKLAAAERVVYYRAVCDSLGLNPLTKPLDYITLNGKLTLYARKDAADQLRRRDGVSIISLDTQIVNDAYIVKAVARLGDRMDAATGVVSIKGLFGDNLANAMMKAETKAKRRVTLSICGLGMLDETEIETVSDARPARVDMETGEIQSAPPAPSAGGNGKTANSLAQFAADATNLKAFYGRASERYGLSRNDVHAALGVEHLIAYPGTMDDAKADLERYIAEHAQQPALVEG